MKETKENMRLSVLDMLPQWRARYAQGCADGGDVRSALQQMCGSVHRNTPSRRREGVQGVLYSWYVPRNEDDAAAYMVRCRMWNVFVAYVDELLNYLMK